MKTYKALVAVTGTFYVEQTVEAESLQQARPHLAAMPRGGAYP